MIRTFWPPPLRLAAVASVLSASLATPLFGQDASCPAGRITSVFVDNKSIYDIDDLEDDAVGWAYSLANTLHVRTRADFIRQEILIEEDDCYDPLLLEESGRLLRSYPFIAWADVFGVEQPDGSWHVVVDTKDEWTTRVDMGASFDDGFNLERVNVTEANLLGRGILVSAFMTSRREQRDRGLRMELPRLFGTRLDTYASAGRTRVGDFYEAGVDYPFVGEVGRWGLRQTFRRRDEVFPYALAGDSAYSHVLLSLRNEWAEASVARRFGAPGDLTLLGVGLSRDRLSFPGPAPAEVALDSDFGNPEPAPAAYAEGVSSQTRPVAATRLNLLFGKRNLRFHRVRGLDALNGLQDIRLGTDVGLTVGRTLGFLTPDGAERSDDLFSRLRLFVGQDPGISYLFLNVAVEGRRRFSAPAGTSAWRDVLGEFDLYGYLRSRRAPAHTFFARVSAAGGWQMDTPFQLTSGGLGGVRGYREEDDPGGRRLLVTLEDRILVGWPAPDLFDMGFTVFGDVGRVWSGDAPFGRTSPWRGAVGAGLRLGFPAGSRGLVRLDVAVPLGSDGSRGPVFRLTVKETLGLLAGFLDDQADRSRRVRIGPDYFVTEAR